MWRSLSWISRRRQGQRRDTTDESRRIAGDESRSEDESIPDDPDDCRRHDTGARCPWGGPTEGDDRVYDFLMRGEWRDDGQFCNVEFRRALLRQLQEHWAVRNPAEHVAWPGSPEDALRKLHDLCDPSRSQLNQVTWLTADSRSKLNLVDDFFVRRLFSRSHKVGVEARLIEAL